MPGRALKRLAWPCATRRPGLCHINTTPTHFRPHIDAHSSVTSRPRVSIPPPHALRELTLDEWKQYQHSHEISPNASGRIHSTDSFTTVDGPGIRYMIFLQGCAMRCLFCCNPDSLSYAGGTSVTVSNLVKAIDRVAPYLRPNYGGVTVSGGEPMLQPTFVASLFDEVHKLGLTTCIDTNGQGTKGHHWDVVLPRTDYVLFCIKHMDPHKYEALTHMKQAPALRFAKELAARQMPFFLRYVYIPGLTDAPDDIDRLIDFAAAQPSLVAIDLLPYHLLGKQKWATLGKQYPLEGVPLPPKEKVFETVRKMEAAGLKVMCNIGEPTLPRWSGRHAN